MQAELDQALIANSDQSGLQESLEAANREIDRLSAEITTPTDQITTMGDEAARVELALMDLQAFYASEQENSANENAETLASINSELQLARQEIINLGEENAMLTRELSDLIEVSVEAQLETQEAFDDFLSRCEENGSCAIIDDAGAIDPAAIQIENENMENQLRAALLELEVLKAQQYVRVERLAQWLTGQMVGRQNQAAIEFEPRRFSLLQDLLFDTNSATLNEAGQTELQSLALILLELEDERVREQVLLAGYNDPVDWVLQIAGHADTRPISGGPFIDNWQLASERALSVLRFLEGEGVPPNRLQAASNGDRKLVEGRDGEDAVNRRISFTVAIR